MKVFIVGLPKSGKTTVAQAIVDSHGYQYIDAISWIRSSFRMANVGEHPNQYEDDYQQYLTKRLKINPSLVVDNIYEIMETTDSEDPVFVIDGIISPQDFAFLFDSQRDIVVFLNRTDNEHEFRDHENIGISVMRDYCHWLSSAGLLDKQKWIEYNFRLPGDYKSDHVKAMGAMNSVFLVKSISRVISHLQEKLTELIDAVS